MTKFDLAAYHAQKPFQKFWKKEESVMKNFIHRSFDDFNNEDIEDVFVVSMLGLWKYVNQRPGKAILPSDIGLLYDICYKQACTFQASKKVGTLYRLDDEEGRGCYDLNNERDLLREARLKYLHELMHLLNPKEHALLQLSFSGYSMEEIAIKLGYKNAQTAKAAKNRAVNHLMAIAKRENTPAYLMAA